MAHRVLSKMGAFALGSVVLALHPLSAQETKTYQYNALGRLVTVERDKASGEQENASYTYDAAGNRTSYTSSNDGGSSPPQPPPQSNIQLRPVFNGRFFVMQKITQN